MSYGKTAGPGCKSGVKGDLKRRMEAAFLPLLRRAPRSSVGAREPPPSTRSRQRKQVKDAGPEAALRPEENLPGSTLQPAVKPPPVVFATRRHPGLNLNVYIFGVMYSMCIYALADIYTMVVGVFYWLCN